MLWPLALPCSLCAFALATVVFGIWSFGILVDGLELGDLWTRQKFAPDALGLVELFLWVHCTEKSPSGAEANKGSKIGPGAHAGDKIDMVRCIVVGDDDSTYEWHTV